MGSPRSCSSARKAPSGLSAIGTRLEPEIGLELELGDQAVEPLSVGSAGVHGEPHPAGNHVHRPRFDVDLADGGDRAVDRARDVSDPQDVLGGGHQGVEATVHGNGARVAGLPFEGALAADDADDPHRQSERNARPLQDRPLFDVHLEEASGNAPRSTKAVLPTQPRSSSLKTATAPFPTRSTASMAATTPSAPSNLPPKGTESRCEPGPDTAGVWVRGEVFWAQPASALAAATSSAPSGLPWKDTNATAVRPHPGRLWSRVGRRVPSALGQARIRRRRWSIAVPHCLGRRVEALVQRLRSRVAD